MDAGSIALSILVPVFNERYLVAESLARLAILEDHPNLSRIEVIVVDDGSTDGTAQVLGAFAQERAVANGRIRWQFLTHEHNAGKGKAIQTALARATGDACIIHDADLEYHPADIGRMISVYLANNADAVFGSRFTGSDVRRVLLYRHQVANKFLTLMCDLVSNLNLTDVWTCYKMVRTDLFKSIPLSSNDFQIEPELTIKLAKREARIFEIPISYFGRTYREGKKIRARDGLLAMFAILRFGVSDEIYRSDQYGSQILARLSRAPRFNLWMADAIRPFCGDRVLEIGSGVGNLSRALLPRTHYVASDINPLYLQTLTNLSAERPYLRASYCDVSDLASFPNLEQGFDTVICLNVLEHVDDARQSLLNIKSVLAPNGRAIVLVPQGPGNFGTLDEVLGHRRRYTRDTLTDLGAQCGMKVRAMLEFNRTGTIAWWLNGRLLRRKRFGLAQIWMLNLITPLMRALDGVLPIAPLSLIAVMEPDVEASGSSREAAVAAPASSLDPAVPVRG